MFRACSADGGTPRLVSAVATKSPLTGIVDRYERTRRLSIEDGLERDLGTTTTTFEPFVILRNEHQREHSIRTRKKNGHVYESEIN